MRNYNSSRAGGVNHNHPTFCLKPAAWLEPCAVLLALPAVADDPAAPDYSRGDLEELRAAGLRTPGLGIGASAPAVRQALGPPDDTRRDASGANVWRYGTGRTVTFDAAGRVVSWTGF